jgi:predicted double-glycine peptidase
VVDADGRILIAIARLRRASPPAARLRVLFRSSNSLVLALGVIAATATCLAAQIGINDAGLRASRPLRSMKDLRDQDLVKQRFDFSCGAAALATMLRYGFGDDVSEQQILIDLFNQLTDEQKSTARTIGFSLLDLQRVAQVRGYAAEGFRLEPAQLPMLGAPVIVFIEPRGYKHFAVLRGISGDRVYLADPSRGNIRMPVHAFLDSWLQDDHRGIIFAVEPKSGETAHKIPALRSIGMTGRPEIIAAREMLTISGPLVRPAPTR